MPERRAIDDPYKHYSEGSIRRTLGAGWAKIHDGCGGLVRWVEAYDRPAVGWVGECLDCGTTNIVEEDIVFVTDPAVPEDIGDAEDLVDEPKDVLGDLSYPMDVQEREGFDAAQDALHDRLREVLC